MKKGTLARVDYTLTIAAAMMTVVTAVTIMAAAYISANSVDDPSVEHLERIARVMKTRKFSVVENDMGNPVIRIQDLSLVGKIRRHGEEYHLLCRPVDAGSPFEAPLLPRVAAGMNFCITKDGSS